MGHIVIKRICQHFRVLTPSGLLEKSYKFGLQKNCYICFYSNNVLSALWQLGWNMYGLLTYLQFLTSHLINYKIWFSKNIINIPNTNFISSSTVKLQTLEHLIYKYFLLTRFEVFCLIKIFFMMYVAWCCRIMKKNTMKNIIIKQFIYWLTVPQSTPIPKLTQIFVPAKNRILQILH